MSLRIVVCVKQVMDPETPVSAFRIDPESKRVIPAPGVPPVVNGFDEHAVEAALRMKDAGDATVTVISVGSGFALDVMKKPVAMGADELILVDDESLENLDAFCTAYALTEAIKKLGEFDLILCGRQASDWDNAHVPMGVAELLGLPCVTMSQKVEAANGGLIVERSLTDGYEVVEVDLPAVVTVTNELGEARYPTLRGIMAASRKRPTVWTASDAGIDPSRLSPTLRLVDLFIPDIEMECELIESEDEAEAGRRLAHRLREENLI